jgi:hypothetical protein
MLSGLDEIKLSNPPKYACADVALFGRAYDGRVSAAVGGGVRDV